MNCAQNFKIQNIRTTPSLEQTLALIFKFMNDIDLWINSGLQTFPPFDKISLVYERCETSCTFQGVSSVQLENLQQVE
jgi:radical SAM superfamily enzyme